MFTYPFKILKARLEAIAELKEVDWYLGQYKKETKGVLKATPAAFIQFTDAPTETIGGDIQTATTSVIVHLVTTNIKDNGDRVNKTTSVDHMSIFDAIYKAIDGKGGLVSELPEFANLGGTDDDFRIFNTLTRNKVVPAHDLSDRMVSMQFFEGVFYDHSKVKTFAKFVADLEIT